MAYAVARPVGKAIDRMFTRMFGGHRGRRALKTSVTLQLFGNLGPLKFREGTA